MGELRESFSWRKNWLAVGVVVGAFDQDVILDLDFWAAVAAAGIRFVVDSVGEPI